MPRPIRLWYAGPQFRYEQPQAGRYREFRQIGVELVGVAVGGGRRGSARDALRVPAGARARRTLIGDAQLHSERGGARGVLEGAAGARPPARRRASARTTASASRRTRCASSTRRIPRRRRVLEGRSGDARLPRRELAGAPRGAQAPPAARRRPLSSRAPSIVRGHRLLHADRLRGRPRDRLGAQNAILGGGRYDDLVADLGGPPTPAVGFAIGEDRLVEAMTADARPIRHALRRRSRTARGARLRPRRRGRDPRARCPTAVVETRPARPAESSRASARAGQLAEDPSRHAFRIGRVQAVLLGSAREREATSVTIKDLATGAQETFPRRQLAERLGAGGSDDGDAATAGGRAPGAATPAGRVLLKGWVAPPPRPRRADLPDDPRPQRARPGRLRPGALPAGGRRGRRRSPQRGRRRDRGRGRAARGEAQRNRGHADGGDRGPRASLEFLARSDDAALRRRGPHERDRGAAPRVPLPRPAPAGHAEELRPARRDRVPGAEGPARARASSRSRRRC